MGCFYHSCRCQDTRYALAEEDIQPGTKKREVEEMWRRYIEEKGFNAVETCECQKWKLYKSDLSLKEHLRESFPYKPLLRQDWLLDKIKSGALFGYVQCEIKRIQDLREKIAFFLPFFKNTNVCRQDIGPLMQESAEKKVLNVPTVANVNSSFEMINGF